MSFTSSTTAALQAVTITREISMKELSQTSSETDTVMNDVSPSFSQSREETKMQEDDISFEHKVEDEAWKQYLKSVPFLAVPPEIHLKIMSILHPIDATCLSLVKYVLLFFLHFLYSIYESLILPLPWTSCL